MHDDQSRSEAADSPDDGGGEPDDRPGTESRADSTAERGGANRVNEEDDADDEEWRFSLADIEERESDEEVADDPEPAARVPEPNSTVIARGSPSSENALFVLVGALVMIAVLLRLVGAGFGI